LHKQSVVLLIDRFVSKPVFAVFWQTFDLVQAQSMTFCEKSGIFKKSGMLGASQAHEPPKRNQKTGAIIIIIISSSS
jgi:hypothetical protein